MKTSDVAFGKSQNKVVEVINLLLKTLFYPCRVYANIKVNRVRKLITCDAANIYAVADYCSLFNLAWEYYDKSDLIMTEKIVDHLLRIYKDTDKFGFKTANIYNLLGLISFETDKNMAVKYLLKTSDKISLPSSMNARSLLLSQKLLDAGFCYEVQKHLKTLIKPYKNYNSIGKNKIKHIVAQLQVYIKKINQPKFRYGNESENGLNLNIKS